MKELDLNEILNSFDIEQQDALCMLLNKTTIPFLDEQTAVAFQQED